ncbi:RNA polymerase sigma-70 factor, ECF subfamily [Psychrobacillus sp. OK028]|uniref:RNA polymerase sigma factor n=1 Tax=Psychrobacillus sp. OK028 TaxID=1884359 RepID=UPI0008860BF2|nr:RNA polymerase sigma factor [Psychrobacillus sp. OK028]SDO25333.1 RNA polymerase sigma-70 factor, ECF subfamily [Psychrobacillus sp. OK028]
MKNEWEQLLLAHAKIVFKYLMKIGARKEDAEDITQETIIKTIECLQQIEPEKMRAWMFKVAIHRYYSLYNKNKTFVHLSEEDLESLKPAIEHVELNLITKEMASEMVDALQELQPTFQQLLILKYYMDFSYKEISEILTMKEATVKTYLQRARNTFKKIWEEKIDGQWKK